MAKNKIQRFAEIENFPNVFHHVQRGRSIGDLPMKGNWHKDFFKNDHPIVLELGCGKGEYTIGLARENANKNFIGVDLKGNRIWVGAKTALDDKMNNVAFLRSRIDNIAGAFDANEVSEIWITFPDPQPQKGRIRKRLTHPVFLERYKKILKKGGTLQLKTDSQMLYEFTLETIQELKLPLLDNTNDLYADGAGRDGPLKNIQTFYESIFSKKGSKICYLSWRLDHP